MMSKSELKKLIEAYTDFNQWLKAHNFIIATIDECSSPQDYHYSSYEKLLPNGSMYGLEIYILHELNLKLKFLRDNDTDLICIIGDGGFSYNLYSVEEAKKFISNYVLLIVYQEMEKLNSLKAKYE